MLTRLLTIHFCAVALISCASAPYYRDAPDMPAIVAPVGGSALILNADTRFEWRPGERGSPYDFHVFNRRTGDIERYFMREMPSADICSETICSVTLSLALPYMSGHAWRVRAGNHAGKSTWTRKMFSMVNGGLAPASQ